MKTQSTTEAMALLKKYRAYLIAKGRREAALIAQREGEVHSRRLRSCLVGLGLLSSVHDSVKIGDYWLGAVFRGSLWKWTGRWFIYSDKERNIHERTIKIWRLTDGADIPNDPRPTPEFRDIFNGEQLNPFPKEEGEQ